MFELNNKITNTHVEQFGFLHGLNFYASILPNAFKHSSVTENELSPSNCLHKIHPQYCLFSIEQVVILDKNVKI